MSDARNQERNELEQALLLRPLDLDLRRRHAKCLFDEEDVEASLAQWHLVVEQGGGDADAHPSAAACCAALGDEAGATRCVASARNAPDFSEDDPRLATLEPAPVHRLRVFPGARSDTPAEADVVSIASTDTVRFSDIVDMEELKKTVRLRIIEPFVHPGLFQRFKRRAGGGVLFYGPPGRGKTMMARAIATECDANFTPVGISDILNLFQGESERNLAAIFNNARDESPSVLFFDELDALAFSRTKARSDATPTLVNEFLNQLDGMAGNNEKRRRR